MQPEPGGKLLGILEINLQRLGQAPAADRHDALVALRPIVVFERHGERALTDQFGEPARERVLAEASQTAHAESARALREQQMHGTGALQLQREHAVELDRGGEQQRRGDRFTEDVAYGLRIGAMLDQRPPRGVEMHQVAANRISLEDESVQAVAIVHQRPPSNLAFSSSLSCAGFARPWVAFITWPTKNPNSLSLPAR